jgi:hypothetical protein
MRYELTRWNIVVKQDDDLTENAPLGSTQLFY